MFTAFTGIYGHLQAFTAFTALEVVHGVRILFIDKVSVLRVKVFLDNAN